MTRNRRLEGTEGDRVPHARCSQLQLADSKMCVGDPPRMQREGGQRLDTTYMHPTADDEQRRALPGQTRSARRTGPSPCMASGVRPPAHGDGGGLAPAELLARTRVIEGVMSPTAVRPPWRSLQPRRSGRSCAERSPTSDIPLTWHRSTCLYHGFSATPTMHVGIHAAGLPLPVRHPLGSSLRAGA